jgi:hypothetical protein
MSAATSSLPHVLVWRAQGQIRLTDATRVIHMGTVLRQSKAWAFGRARVDRGFESHRGHGCLSLESLCCQAEVSVTD